MASRRRELRILYVYPDTMGPSAAASHNALHHFAGFFSGEMIPILIPTGREAVDLVAATKNAIGNFSIHPVQTSLRMPIVRQLSELLSIVRIAMQLARSRGDYDAVVAHGAYRTGLAGLILGRLWGIPTIVEFPGHPVRGLALDTSTFGRLKVRIAPYIVAFVARHASRLRLLYPEQLDDVVPRELSKMRQRLSIFHEFVPVSSIVPREAKKPVILFVGFPWYLKGVDVLIRAFLQIANEYPAVTLRIVGYCPDLQPWLEMTKGHPRIELLGPMPNAEITKAMAESQIFVLPSRTEAMGRVLLEAMASRTPIVASRVDGIPYYVRDEIDGLLVQPGDVEDLARQLRRMLGDPALRDRLAADAEIQVRTKYSERAYVDAFYEMVQAAVNEASTPSAS